MEQKTNIEDLGKKINERIQNNVYASYALALWNKYKFILLFIVILILITFIEVKVATCTSDCAYSLDKYAISKINPPCLNLPDGVYIYVYNTSAFNSRDVMEKTGAVDYNKLIVGEHISNQISHPIHKIKEGFTNMFTSGTPINALTNNILNSQKLRDVINPLNSFNNYDSSWRVLYPNGVHLNCFSSNGTIYFSK